MSKRKEFPQKVGKKLTPNGAYARTLGVHIRVVVRLGGVARLEAMQPEARKLMLSLIRRK